MGRMTTKRDWAISSWELAVNAKIYSSGELDRLVESQGTFERDERAEMRLVKIHPEYTHQRIDGFGGAITEASAFLYASMPQELREVLLASYFGPGGARYTLCRMPIQSCDFSLGPYSYVRRGVGDPLGTFSMGRDERWLVPMALDALASEPRLSILSSPWSPPGFMKTNHHMAHGGRLRGEWADAWARVMARYALEMRERGLPVERMTVQNEPRAAQTWESCLYDAQAERDFAADHLVPALDEAGMGDMRLLAWDHNKERLLERAEVALGREHGAPVFSGIAFHWYSGDHFEALEQASRCWPESELVMSEGCGELRYGTWEELDLAEKYAHDIIGDLCAGATAWIDWNLLLDERGGPNHVRNFCAAPATYDRREHTLRLSAAHAYISQFSRFVEPGARRLLVSRFSDAVEACAFSNPSGTHVCVLLNRTEIPVSFKLHERGRSLAVELAAHSIETVAWGSGV